MELEMKGQQDEYMIWSGPQLSTVAQFDHR
jgi:hypothetical protein